MLGGSFNKQRDLTYEASLGQKQNEWVSTFTHQILEVHIAMSVGSHQIYHADVSNIWNGTRKWNPHSKVKRGGKESRGAQVHSSDKLAVTPFQ